MQIVHEERLALSQNNSDFFQDYLKNRRARHVLHSESTIFESTI